MFIIDKIKSLKKSLSGHEPLIEVFVFKDNLLHNLREYQTNYPKLQFAPVLKANAYGHGLEQALKILKGSADVPFIALDSHFEARIAQKYAPNLQVLIIGYSRLESINKTSSAQSAFTIISLDQLKEVSLGLRAKKHKEGVLDIGLYSSKKGARIYAALKGCVDAGLAIPHGEQVLPSQDRLRGEHIKVFLSTCKTPHQFSSYRKSQLKPEDIPLHVDELKNKILKMNHEKKD